MVIVTATAAARSVFRSTTMRNAAARLASKTKPSPSPFRSPPSSKPLSHRVIRHPVELSAMMESMQPYHSATASSLMISNLTVSRCGYGWLFDDM